MTLPADSNAGDETSTALAPVLEGADGVDLLLAKPEAETVEARSLGARLLDYSAHAAMIVGLIGFAWTVSDHVVARPTASQLEATQSGTAPLSGVSVKDAASKGKAAQVPGGKTEPVHDDLAELRLTNAKLAADVHALQSNLDKLRSAVAEDKTPAQMRVLQAGLEQVKSSLAATRTETNGALTQITGKLETIGRDTSALPPSKMQQLVDRLGRLEHASVDLTPTASLPQGGAVGKTSPAATVPVPPGRPSKVATLEPAHDPGRESPNDGVRVASEKVAKEPIRDAAKDMKEQAKPPVLASWVVRDVYDGVALIEGHRGTLEVVPGVSVPGAGTVKSIDRHGSGWTVTTTKGLMVYAAATRPDRRFGPRDDFRGNRYDDF